MLLRLMSKVSRGSRPLLLVGDTAMLKRSIATSAFFYLGEEVKWLLPRVQ